MFAFDQDTETKLMSSYYFFFQTLIADVVPISADSELQSIKEILHSRNVIFHAIKY